MGGQQRAGGVVTSLGEILVPSVMSQRVPFEKWSLQKSYKMDLFDVLFENTNEMNFSPFRPLTHDNQSV